MTRLGEPQAVPVPGVVLALAAVLSLPAAASAADWPTERYDAGRTSASPQQLAAELHLHWVRELPSLKPAWPDQAMMQFDTAYEPIVVGKTLLIGSPRHDCVTALDTETGDERWTFFADGPVRFAPAAWDGKVYFVSDDGHLYCLDAATGKLRWKFRGGPGDRRCLGNERLVSAWPARGAPVVVDSTVYFGASIWPFMGIFLHALDARTGDVVWTNDGDGSLYMKQPHNADSFAGVAPQGALVATGDKLLVPGGRSVPACYDRKTGKLLHYRLAENSKIGGGAEVSARGSLFVNGGAAFTLENGEHVGPVGEPVVLTDEVIYTAAAGEIRAYAVGSLKIVDARDRKGKKIKRIEWPKTGLGSAPLPDVQVLIKAGSRLYAAAGNHVSAIDLPLSGGRPATPSWHVALEGTPAHLVAADDRLFVVTREGLLKCYGPTPVVPRTIPLTPVSPVSDAASAAKARTILKTTNARDGYCVAWGVGGGRLIHELVRQSNLHVIVVEPDAARVDAFRRELVAAGLYGERVAVLPGNPATVALPPYLASLIVSEDPSEPSAAFLKNAFASLRPYGGAMCLQVVTRLRFAELVSELELPNAQLRDAGEYLLLAREGALPGAANWTHEHADAANSRVSRDQLVKVPLGILWFGGPSHEGVLPRHGHGPQPQVIDGRVIVEGTNFLRATDAYTGRLLWTADLPGVGRAYDNLAHQPGANATGTNYVSLPDGTYVVWNKRCLRLDPATGKKVREFRLPPAPGSVSPQTWGYLNVFDDYLVGGAEPDEDDASRVKNFPLFASFSFSRAASRQLVVLNRHTGAVLWTATAKHGFRHNAICAGGGRLYAIDRVPPSEIARLKRRGETTTAKSRLIAFDNRSGKELWSTDADVFGTWLSYSAEHDVVIESGRVARDTLADEPKGMRAYYADDGKVLWGNEKYVGPAMLRGRTVLKDRSACDLLTGAPLLRKDPFTGEEVEWTWVRNYGCNTPAASEHLLTFRSGAAGFCDLDGDAGTGNFGGFRSSCTNNLIVAGGLINVPDYTRTCTCSYQNQTSLALVPMPDVELWTFFATPNTTKTVRRAGINFGAPGDRKAPDGTLWIEYPATSGPSPKLAVRTVPEKPEVFRRHESVVEGDGLKWVAASGLNGVTDVSVELVKPPEKERAYTVRLHFVEPDSLRPGQRMFHVGLQGQEVLRDFDIVREAGGPYRALVKEFKRVRVTKGLRVTLTAMTAEHGPVLCGIEVIAEGW